MGLKEIEMLFDESQAIPQITIAKIYLNLIEGGKADITMAKKVISVAQTDEETMERALRVMSPEKYPEYWI